MLSYGDATALGQTIRGPVEPARYLNCRIT